MCDPEGLDLRSTARARADIATVAFVVAGVAAASGIVVWSWSSRANASKTTMGLGVAPGLLSLTGSF